MDQHLNRKFTEEETQMVLENKKESFSLQVIMEVLVQNTEILFHFCWNNKHIKKSDCTIDWQCYGAVNLFHCCCECKLVEPLLRAIWHHQIKLKLFKLNSNSSPKTSQPLGEN